MTVTSGHSTSQHPTSAQPAAPTAQAAPAAPAAPTTPVTVSTIGEAMVVLLPESQRPLAETRRFDTAIGGAEFNVASSVARLGVPAHWLSRLGDDGFGEYVLDVATAAGVLTDAVELDPTRSTGLYIKETVTAEDGSRAPRMHYYRSGSAASAIDTAYFRRPESSAVFAASGIVHTSGITAALSPDTAAAIADVRAHLTTGAVLSVDLNYRPRLWAGRTTEPLRRLIEQADILFLGVDEAEGFFGHADAARLFAEFPRLVRIVFKNDAISAVTAHRADAGAGAGAGAEAGTPIAVTSCDVPCLTVDVVETVGAGDAFAAGYLVGLATGLDDTSCTRIGHATAASTLICHGDRPDVVPTPVELRRIIDATPAEWSGWSVAPGRRLPWADTAAPEPAAAVQTSMAQRTMGA